MAASMPSEGFIHNEIVIQHAEYQFGYVLDFWNPHYIANAIPKDKETKWQVK